MPKKCWRDLSIPSVSENREGKEKELWEGKRAGERSLKG